MADIRVDDAALQRILHSPDGPVAGEVVKATRRVERAARRNLSRPGGGRVYVKRNPRRIHRASAPGHPPATDTGRLRSSVDVEFGVDEGGFYGQVGTEVAYGRWLEHGTEDILPRPWLRPAGDAARPGPAGDV